MILSNVVDFFFCQASGLSDFCCIYTLFANETALIKLASLLNPKFQSFKIAVSLANGV
jgi:hypothetical protein